MSASCETSPGYADQPLGQRDLPPALWTDYSNYKVILIVVNKVLEPNLKTRSLSLGSGLSISVKMELIWSDLSLVWQSWTTSSLPAAEERASAGTEERFSQLIFSFLNTQDNQE